jgi:hypothetical protein
LLAFAYTSDKQMLIMDSISGIRLSSALFAAAVFTAGNIPTTTRAHAGGAPSTRLKVQDFGAAGDGKKDDTSRIQAAIDTSSPDSVIDFGQGFVYRIRAPLVLKPFRHYTGASTIKLSAEAASGTPMAIAPYTQATGIGIEGLTWDANGRGGVLLLNIGGSNYVPADKIVIRNCTFRNSKPDPLSGAQTAIYDPVGLTHSVIAGNAFINVGGGLDITNPGDTEITDNSFDSIRQNNAIFIHVTSPRAGQFSFGKNVVIARNRGTNLMKMAIEVFSETADNPLSGMIVEGNQFTAWNPAAAASTVAFGISIVAGVQHRIAGNVLSGGVGPIGIELGAANTIISGNSITDFDLGIVAQHYCDNATISKNKLYNQRVGGIQISNARNNPKLNLKIRNNYIENSGQYGIGYNAATEYKGVEISENTILRQGGLFPDDSHREFTGIQVQAGAVGPSSWTGNRVVQAAAHPPSAFPFIGFAVMGGFAGNYFGGNRVESRSVDPHGVAFYLRDSRVLDGAVLENNTFVSLERIANIALPKRFTSRNNAACNVRGSDPHVITATGARCTGQ